MNGNEKFKSIFDDVKSRLAEFDATSYGDFLAIQITLSDTDGVFYIEIKDGVLTCEPYPYDDRQANIIMKADNFVKMIDGKLGSVVAFTTGKLKIEGSISKAKELSKLMGGK